jgi:hypothetical protein
VEDLKVELLCKTVPLLSNIRSPCDTGAAAHATGWSRDPVIVQIEAYAYARCADIPRAVRTLDQLLALLVGDVRPWVRQMFDRATELRNALETNPGEAKRQLLTSEAETVKALGLARFLANTSGTSVDTMRKVNS